ncbi:MAG: hypothetical protein ACOX3S_10470 [Anaerolineae bacterium]|jgi:hypothetical protein
MRRLTAEEFADVRRWIYRNARPLDLARWRYHFEGGASDEVLLALSAYQNADGGMGHALEADAWNPHSAPIQASTAVGILREVGMRECAHPLVQGLLRYLDSGSDMAHGRWCNTVPSNNDHPHAPWWHTGSESSSHSEFNPTAILVGFILEYAERDSDLYLRGLTIARELAAAFRADPHLSMHPLLCVVDLLAAIFRTGLQQAFDCDQLVQMAHAEARDMIWRDAGDWTGYACRPSHFVTSPRHPLYADLSDLVERELDYIVAQRNAAGIWDITWRWDAYPAAFAVSERWWQANVAIENMRYLEAFGHVAR